MTIGGSDDTREMDVEVESMAGWAEFALAFALFMGAHMVPARPAVRGRLVATLGERAYLAGYIVLSLGLLAWLVAAAGRAPYVALWGFAPWQMWVPNVAMPFACLLAAFAVGAPNPLSFGGRASGFEPEQPGIVGITRHPIPWALALWAGAHVVPNGDLAHVILFGAFTLFALLGAAAIDRRMRRRLGEDEWRRLSRRTSFLPLAALATGRWRPARRAPGVPRLVAAAALWLALLALHPAVIGVSPLPQ